MTDWSGNDFPITPLYEAVLRRPPVVLLGTMAGAFALSIVMFAVDSKVGYGLCVVATVLGALVSNRDQSARSDPNYVTLGWFRPLKMLLSYGTTLIACAHIAILAIESAR
jgi:hypothetical protein